MNHAPTVSPSDIQARRCSVLGVHISPINYQQAIAVIDSWIDSGQQQYVTVTGVHGVMESQRDLRLKKIHNQAGLVTPDGMPMVWLSKLAGFDTCDRVYGPDLMLACCERSVDKGWRHFLCGGAKGVAKELKAVLERRFPGIQIVGTFCPPFRPLTEEDQQVIDLINNLKADIVWVGLSTPKQERWMAEHLGKLTASVMIGVGAAFDFHTGRVRQAPRWIQRSGLEWMFRMAMEPRRLAKRYLTNNPVFLYYLLLDWLGMRDFSLPARFSEHTSR